LKRWRFFLISIAILAILGGFISGARAKISNRVVAVVNDEVITIYELHQKIREATGLNPIEVRSRDEERYRETAESVLDALVNERIARQEIEKLGIDIQAREVDAAVEKVKRNNQISQEELVESLRQRGLSYENYRQQIKSRLEKKRLLDLEVNSKIVVRDEELAAYYSNHRDEFGSPEKIRLAAIFLQGQNRGEAPGDALRGKARELLSRIRRGESFAHLAQTFSQGPGAEEGGDLGFFEVTQLDSELRQVIRSMSPGEVSEPIIRPGGIQIVQLLERQPGRVKPLEEVRERIYSVLYRSEVERRYAAWVRELRKKAYIQISF
jgi:peptidyl-prolyl cis-trans isomerase SurA